jgi:hypothetical protein
MRASLFFREYHVYFTAVTFLYIFYLQYKIFLLDSKVGALNSEGMHSLEY